MLEKFGIGIDIVNIEDFKKISFKNKPKFYKKLFLDVEIKYCLKFKNSSEHFAGKFALKEAVKKSLNKKISMLKIETFHENSKPRIKLNLKNNKYQFLVSLSHEKKTAIAVVISEELN